MYCAVSKQYRHFTPSSFKKYPWLYYSRAEDGAFCRACAFFAPELPGGHSTGQFVTAPFTIWRKLSDKALAHGKLDYHLASLAKIVHSWIVTVTHYAQAIDKALVLEARKRIEANKKVISSLLDIILLCRKQGIAFRSHRDDCLNWENIEDEHSKPGNSIELAPFRKLTIFFLNVSRTHQKMLDTHPKRFKTN